MNGCQLPGCRKSLFLENQTEPYLQAHVLGLGNSTGLGWGRWGCSASLLALGLQLRTAQGPGPAGALSPQIGSGSPGGSGSHQASPGLPPRRLWEQGVCSAGGRRGAGRGAGRGSASARSLAGTRHVAVAQAPGCPSGPALSPLSPGPPPSLGPWFPTSALSPLEQDGLG